MHYAYPLQSLLNINSKIQKQNQAWKEELILWNHLQGKHSQRSKSHQRKQQRQGDSRDNIYSYVLRVRKPEKAIPYKRKLHQHQTAMRRQYYTKKEQNGTTKINLVEDDMLITK